MLFAGLTVRHIDDVPQSCRKWICAVIPKFEQLFQYPKNERWRLEVNDVPRQPQCVELSFPEMRSLTNLKFLLMTI